MNLKNNFCDTLLLNMYNEIKCRYSGDSTYNFLFRLRHDGITGMAFADNVPDHYVVMSWVNKNKFHVELFNFLTPHYNNIVTFINECCKIAEDFDIEVSNVDNIINMGNTHYAKIKTAGQEYYIELLENSDKIRDVTYGYPVKVEMIKFIKDE